MIQDRRVSDDNEPAATVSDDAAGAGQGRPILIGLAIISIGLLLSVGGQTQTRPEGSGWWNEPALAPTAALLLTFGSAVLGTIFPRRREWLQPAAIRASTRLWLRAFVLATAFLLALWSIAYVGYGIATFLLAATVSFVAGYRGTRLWIMSVVVTLVMVLCFRVILGVWFPEAEIFKLVPLLQPLARYL